MSSPRHLYFILLVIVTARFLAGCGGSEDGGNPDLCKVGSEKSCVCAGGFSGVQTCQGDGFFGPCGCAVEPDYGTSSDVIEATVIQDVEPADASKDAAKPGDPGTGACGGPLSWTCLDETNLYRCVEGVVEQQPCPEDEVCVTDVCLPMICEPGAVVCTGESSFKKCDSLGTTWVQDLPCVAGSEIEAFCDEGSNECVCELPVHVLFVLDASGSMQLEDVSPGVTQWDTALEAISQIMDQYPFLTYGLATFPNQEVDCGTDQCVGAGGCGYTNGVNLDLAKGQVQQIKDYLFQRKLAADVSELEYVLTPLLGMARYLADFYPDDGPLKDHPFPAYVVLISDGRDSCFNPLKPHSVIGPLAYFTEKLLSVYGVKTFTIGFNLENGQEQLDAVAMHGGTGLAEYIPAGDLTTLLAGFKTIFDSMEIRNCDEWTDLAMPPACTDADADGWCASLDCSDSEASVNHGMEELQANGADDDCDGVTDEPPDDQQDQDGDGFTPSQGDCDDFDPLTGPGAFEIPVDGADNDCDGLFDETSCDCQPVTGSSLEALACASELSCQSGVLKSQKTSSSTGDSLGGALTAVTHFGSSGNDLQSKKNGAYTLVASGPATGTNHSVDLSGGGAGTDPYSSSDSIYDVVEYEVVLQAPTNAQGFSIDYVFFSEEYDDYVGTTFNDKFYLILNAPKTTGGQNKVINFTDCRDPGDYWDLTGADCPLASGYCCYIAINTALSECCWYNGCPYGKWTTDISGTGFTCASSSSQDSDDWGSSTGWLTTSWTIEPKETFKLTFHVHDTGDGIFDSEVILDNFRWHATPTTPGTEPTN